MRALGCLASVAVVLGIASGCGEDRSSQPSSGSSEGNSTGTGAQTSAEPAGKPVATVDVSESEFKLDPPRPSVGKAGTVEFKVSNDGKVVHALEVEGPNGEKQTPAIRPGRSATLKVDLGKAGSYEWYCPVGDHKQRGMKGAIKVAGGGSGGSTSTEDSGGDGTDDSGGGGTGGY